jgi:hypothetical protein
LLNFRIAAVVLFVSLCGMSWATAGVVYQFSGTTVGGGAATAGLTQGFTTITADYLSPANGTPGFCPGYGCILPSDVVPGTCIGCDPEILGGVLTVAQFFPGYPLQNPLWDYLGFFVNSSRVEYIYNFPLGSFSAPGTYHTFTLNGNSGTLTVSLTPEPSTRSCVPLTLISFVLLVRRKRHLY